MPDFQTIQQTVLRYGNYALDGGYLSVVPRTVVFSRAVNMASIGDQLTAISYDDAYSGVGAYTDVQADMEIEVHDGNNTAIKGRLRVAYGGASSTVIQINEISEGRLAVADNDRFDVLDEFRLRDKLVGATETFPKDSRREYVDEGDEPAPNIIVGGAAVGWLDPITGVLEVDFDASGSYPTDPDNTGGLEYLWDVGDGTITVGTDADDSITVEFDTTTTDFRHVTLTVTDADTGKATVRKIPVWSHDPDNLPIIVTQANYSFDRQRGDWSASFTLDGDGVDIDSLRDGCFVVYWEVERYDGGAAPGAMSYGNEFTGRSNVKFAGYLRRETISINPDNDTLTIEAISPLAKLGELAGFSQVLDTESNPATWQQDEQVTVNKLLWYVTHYHSTLSICHDLVVPDTDYDFPNFRIQQSTLLEQLREVAQGVSCAVLCDATGRIIVKRNLQRGTTSERSAADVVLDVIAQDLREVPNLVYEHAYQYNSVLLKMFTTLGAPMLSIAPGEAPAEAPDRSTFERGIGVGQAEANEMSGHVFAELNSLYDGKGVPKGMTLKPHAGYGVLDPAYPHWMQVTLASTTNKRGRALSGDKFICAKIDISTDAESGLKDITWTVDHETRGAAGITRAVPPETTLPPYNPSIYVPTPTPLPSLTPRLPLWNGVDQVPTKLFLCDSGAASAHVATAWSPGLSTLSYTALTGLSDAAIWACPDPYDYRARLVLTLAGIERNTNIWSGNSFSMSADNDAIFGDPSRLCVYGEMSINRKGYIAVCTGANTFAYTGNYGSSWNVTSVNGSALSYNTALPSSGSPGRLGFGISPRNSSSDGVIYAAVYTGSGLYSVYKSADWGANWSLVASGVFFGFGGRVSVVVPWVKGDGTPNSNGGSQWVYISGDGRSGGANSFQVSKDGGTTWNNVYTPFDTQNPNTPYVGRGIQIFTYDGDIAIGVLQDDGAGQNVVRMRITDDSTVVNTTSNVFNGDEHYCGINGFPVHSLAALLFARTDPNLWWTVDGGVTGQAAAAPAGYTGIAWADWDISDLVAAA